MEDNQYIFAIPGLGLDGRIFDGIQISGYTVQVLEYINPLEDETLDAYVDRMMEALPPEGEPILLMGHSFGGIIAQEISKKRPCKGLILLSTIMDPEELPPYLSVMRKLPAYDLIKKEIIRRTYFIWGEQDGYNNYEERKIFMEMTDKLSDYYYRWAVRSVVQWTPKGEINCPFLRLHGSRDKTFLYRFLKGDFITISGGTHVVLKSKAEVVSAYIKHFLERLPAKSKKEEHIST